MDDDVDHEALLEFLYACPIGLIEIDEIGTITMINPHAMKHLATITSGRTITNLFTTLENCAPELRNLYNEFPHTRGLVCDGHRIAVDIRRERPTGSLKVLACSLVKIGGDRAIATLSDITAQVENERRLKLAETWFGSLLHGVNDYAVLTIRPDGLILAASTAFTRQTGLDADAVRGCLLDTVLDSEEASGSPCLSEQLETAARDGWSLDEGWQRRANGERYRCQRLLAAQMSEDGATLTGYVVVLRDVVHQTSDTAELQRRLTRDHLTGAVNRTHFLTQFNFWHRRWDNGGQPLSLIMLDIDHFKNINDRHGHPAGDLVLQAFTESCTASLRKGDLFARIGGEEFAVLLPNTTLDEALALANMLRETVATTIISLPGVQLSLTASFGCSTACINVDGVDGMIKAADEHLYMAKRAGRDRVCGPREALAAV